MTILGNPVEVNLEDILFATGFSASAGTATVYVQALAERYRSRVRLMHVVDLSAASEPPKTGFGIDVFRKVGRESLSQLRSELDSEEIHGDTVLCEAKDPAQEILEATEQRSTSLLVIG